VLQQSLAAAVIGLVIGYIVLRSGSLLPGVLFHLTHNSLMLIVPHFYQQTGEEHWVRSFLTLTEHSLVYQPVLALACGALAIGMLYWLHRQPYAAFDEERLQQALDHQTPLTAKPQWRFW
jgi:sodium transport system permease protein